MFLLPILGYIAAAVAGLAILSIIGAPKIKSPPKQKIGEIAKQTAKENEPRTVVFGKVKPIGGNIIYCSGARVLTKEVGTGQHKRGGALGTGRKREIMQDVEYVVRDYAIGICEGEVQILKAWQNEKLMMDAAAGYYSNLILQHCRFYSGSFDQAPDPLLQKVHGANCPAYRGTAYMVVENQDLTDFAGAVPQWQFEVER